jgi:recombination protein RecA
VVERFKPKAEKKASPKAGGVYFRPKQLKFINTGCTLLNCALSGRGDGGWPLGRIVNIVGDKSVGKTLLAIEAAANLAKEYTRGHIWYREAEAAFDLDYAGKLGLPIDRVDFGPQSVDTLWDTVEKIYVDLEKCLATAARTGQPGLYIVDSLDALTSDSELELDITDGSFGTAKAKKMSEAFRRGIPRKLRDTNVCLIFISQIRDKINVKFGKKYTRAGGKSLDFYASLVVYLSHISTLTRTIGKIKRATGVLIKAKCDKNKIATPFRDCTFPINFGYGVDDESASLEWLEEIGKLGAAGYSKMPASISDEEALRLRIAVPRIWAEVEKGFEPLKRKYA